MGKKIKFELNREGVRELLTSEEMQSLLRKKGEKVRSACKQGSTPPSEYSVSVKAGGKRASCKIGTATPKAAKSNAKHNTLLKALGGGS